MKMIAVGDISLGDFFFCPGFGIRSAIEGGLDPFQEVKSLLTTSDITFGNLETVISDTNLNPKVLESWEMRGSPKSVSLLKKAGFNIVNVANNHTMQHGIEAFRDTITTLNQQGILTVGVLNGAGNGCLPIIIDVGSRRVGFLGYAFEDDKYKNSNVGYAYGHTCDLKHDIEHLKQQVDTVVVSCHWGLEFMDAPSPNTIQLGRKIIDWGADLILGHHSHTLQGVEEYSGKLIVYSMGNFLFDMSWNAAFQHTSLFEFTFNEDKIALQAIPAQITKGYHIELTTKEGNFANLCKKVNSFMSGDIERNTLKYYVEYEHLRKRNRLECYKFFLQNFFKVKKHFIYSIIHRTIKRRLFNLFRCST